MAYLCIFPGYKPNEDILVIGIDGEMDSFKSVIAGEMSATVVSSPMYGPITFDTVEKILAGQEVPEQTIMEGVVVDAGNAQENYGTGILNRIVWMKERPWRISIY